MKEFITAVEEVVAENEDEKRYVEFKIDDRVLRSYVPDGTQLIFLGATLGRGQTTQNRFSSMLNLLFESLRDEDREYIESRLITRDPKVRLQTETIEGVFAYLLEEWFATPTDEQSTSADSEPPTTP